MARVVVVGAGMAGLAVAARLAAAGHGVVVLEQADVVGGKLGWIEQSGFGFDTGPSLLTLPEVYRDLFEATGAPLDDVLDLTELDVACHYRFADGTALDLPGRGRARTREALDDALGGGAGDQWLALLGRAEAVWDATRGPFLESPVRGARTLLALSRRGGDIRTIAPWLSLRGLGGLYLRDERLVALLDRYATYTGSDPRRAPAALVTIPHVEHTYGSWYVRGGLRRLATATAERARSVGAVVRTGADVARVVVAGGAVRGVVLRDGERLPADVVVAACDAAHLYGTLMRGDRRPAGAGAEAGDGAGAEAGVDRLDGPPGRAVARAGASLRRATPSLSGFVVLLGLRGRTPGLRHHTVLFPADYDAEFDAVFGTRGHQGRPRPVADPTVYVSAPDDPATRPDDDSEAWFVLVNAPRHVPDDPHAGVDWRAAGIADAYADHVLAVMARRGLDVRDRVVTRTVRTPADLERDTRSPGGSIYGSSSNGARSAFLRPSNAGAVRGLYLVGGSSHPGGGLPLVAMSARIVADAIGLP